MFKCGHFVVDIGERVKQQMTGFDLTLWRRGMNWTQERAAAELGIGRTSIVKYESMAAMPVPRTVQLAAVALSLQAEWPTMKSMSKERLLHHLKNEVLRTDIDE